MESKWRYHAKISKTSSSGEVEILADSRRRQFTLGVLLLRHELRRLGLRHRDQRRLLTSRYRIHQFSHQGMTLQLHSAS